ncbi:hypothetical protein GCM10022403_017260 [Streptomyces coacervatus]|uniref:Uncharacterized protein n=1 Tax=Streptomyces coacervatus TaxID=647381 RepID=A0ABP7H5V2_9ACTN
MAHGDRQHHQGGARDAQPHHMERVESRLDQWLGRDPGSTEGDRGPEGETEPDTPPAAPMAAFRRMHRHMMTGDDMSVTPDDTCLSGWTTATAPAGSRCV